MRRKKYLTKKAIAELNLAHGNYMRWVQLSKQYSRAALLKAGLLKVFVPFKKRSKA